MKTEFPTDQQYTLPALNRSFYARDVLEVAPDLIGKLLVVKPAGQNVKRYKITEVEAYRGIDDRACHASKGRTRRTEVMFGEGGRVYVYFVYGMYWMLNIVTGRKDDPQAALIRGVEGFCGPGKLTRELGIDGSFYGEDLTDSKRIWVEESSENSIIITAPRVGIDYAGEPWKSKPWRFMTG
jgi:DNA-3-methyladenine glycosylase